MKTENSSLPVFLFYGEDDYSNTEKLNFWKTEFIKKYGDNALEILEAKNMEASQFITNIESMPFLSEKRMIIIKDFLATATEEDQKLVAKNLEKTPDFNIVIFYETKAPDKRTSLYKILQKSGKMEYFEEMKADKINQWILERATQKNLKINSQNAIYLSQKCGTNLWKLSNELEKLKLFAQEAEVDKKTIDKICTPSLTSSIFKLTDEIAQKNPKASLQTIKILTESGEDPVKIFFMIVRQFRILIQVHELIEKGEKPFSITKKLNQHPFVIQKTSGQCKNFTTDSLKTIYEKLLQIDIETKTGGIKMFGGDKRQLELAIEKFIVECCREA